MERAERLERCFPKVSFCPFTISINLEKSLKKNWFHLFHLLFLPLIDLLLSIDWKPFGADRAMPIRKLLHHRGDVVGIGFLDVLHVLAEALAPNLKRADHDPLDRPLDDFPFPKEILAR